MIDIPPHIMDISLWDYTVLNIDEKNVRLGDVVKGAKAVIFVNVATK